MKLFTYVIDASYPLFHINHKKMNHNKSMFLQLDDSEVSTLPARDFYIQPVPIVNNENDIKVSYRHLSAVHILPFSRLLRQNSKLLQASLMS